MAVYKGNRGDLGNAIRLDMRRLFGQLERGLTVEFGVNTQGSEEENKKTLQEIASVGKVLKFPEVPKEPLLLNSGEVIEDAEGESVHVTRQTKTTKTRKTTTTKKSPEEEAKQDSSE